MVAPLFSVARISLIAALGCHAAPQHCKKRLVSFPNFLWSRHTRISHSWPERTSFVIPNWRPHLWGKGQKTVENNSIEKRGDDHELCGASQGLRLFSQRGTLQGRSCPQENRHSTGHLRCLHAIPAKRG